MIAPAFRFISVIVLAAHLNFRSYLFRGDITRLRLRSADSTLPHLWPTGSSWVSPSLTARYFSAGPSDSTSRWPPCPPKYSEQWLQVSLGCIQLSLSCPFRPLHTFRFLRPARLRTPLLGYGAPHLSARGTSTLLNNALLSAHFRCADHPPRIVGILCNGVRRL
jgi:hypothetical protein